MAHSLIYHQERVKWGQLRPRYHRTQSHPTPNHETDGSGVSRWSGTWGFAPCESAGSTDEMFRNMNVETGMRKRVGCKNKEQQSRK
jgi:hypothetical protein